MRGVAPGVGLDWDRNWDWGRGEDAAGSVRLLYPAGVADPKAAIQQALAQAGQGRLKQAIGALERMTRKRGAPAEAYHFLGLLMAQDARAEQAVFHMERASKMAPGRPQMESNFANVLAGLGRLDEAIERYRLALERDERYAPARVGLAGALLSKGAFTEAEAAARAAWGLAPDNPDAAANLASCLITTGQAHEAVDHLRAAVEALGPSIQLNTLLTAAMNYDARTTPEAHLEAHRMLGRLHAVAAKAFAERLPGLKKLDAGAERIRVGYLSADFRDHPVGMFIEPALESEESGESAVEVYCYDVTGRPDGFNTELRKKNVTWREARGADDAALAAMIRRDGIDLLVELSGHSLGHRQTALAARCAPVQASTLGYPATTGNPAVDLRLVDGLSDPAGNEAWCTERLVRLDPCAWCFSEPAHAPEVTPPPSEGTGAIAFGSFNNLAKTTPEVLATWAKLLERVPGSVLVLKNGAFFDEGTRERVGRELAGLGVDGSRLRLLEPTHDASGHLAAYADVDVALDTFPYAGTTTTCEAMWMGVPVVTLAGTLHAGRVGVSLLHAVGLDTLVAQDAQAYVQIAAGLAADGERLRELRASLRERMRGSVLMDRGAFRARLHEAYREIVREACS